MPPETGNGPPSDSRFDDAGLPLDGLAQVCDIGKDLCALGGEKNFLLRYLALRYSYSALKSSSLIRDAFFHGIRSAKFSPLGRTPVRIV